MSNTELIHYCKALDEHVTTEHVACESCGHGWVTGYGHDLKCRHCHPDQPKSLAEQAMDETVWPGHEFVWAPDRGRRGRWMLLDDYMVVSRSQFREVHELLPEGDLGEHFASAIKRELLRLNNELSLARVALAAVESAAEPCPDGCKCAICEGGTR